MASITFEVECEVEGQITPSDESVGYPGGDVEDAGISSVSMLKAERPGWSTKIIWKSIDLLQGLSPANRDIVIANIMQAFGSDIDQAILEDVE